MEWDLPCSVVLQDREKNINNGSPGIEDWLILCFSFGMIYQRYKCTIVVV